MSAKKPKRGEQNGKLNIELPFDDAVRAALKTQPPAKPAKRRRRKKTV